MDTETARRRLTEERERLNATLAGLETDIEAQKESLQELSVVDEHQADIGTETFEREKDLSILESVQAGIADIDAAEERLERGTYGSCEVCHNPIPDDRLDALPAARFCVEHQAQVERAPSP
jgi:RNA polymerase-binding transcription factor DksA